MVDDVPRPSSDRPRRVVVAGGGIAALEVVLALRDLVGDRVQVTLVAPDVHFRLRPMEVARPFARGFLGELPLDRFMAEQGGRLRAATVTRVDADRGEVVCDDGGREPYEDLVLALGARPQVAFEHALTFGMTDDRDALNGVLDDLEQGYSSSLAFIVPDGCTWPLPLYELALMTARELRDLGRDAVELHLVTPEASPLEVFGAEASAGVASLVAQAGVQQHLGARARVPKTGRVEWEPDGALDVERIVALPDLAGPRIPGLPHDAAGFLPVDARGRVEGHPHVCAVGDATAGAIKQGGVASQQADLVAGDLAAELGLPPSPEAQAPVLRGRLLTGHGDRWLEGGGPSGASRITDRPPDWAAGKVFAKHLGPYLEQSDLIHLPVCGDRPPRR